MTDKLYFYLAKKFGIGIADKILMGIFFGLIAFVYAMCWALAYYVVF